MVLHRLSKEIAFFVCAGLLCCLICCNSDDDGTPPDVLEGVLWTQAQSEFVNCSNPDDEDTRILECTEENCITVRYDDGIAVLTEVIAGVRTTTEFPYTLSGNRISSGGFSATFEVRDGELIVTNENVFGCQLIETWVNQP